MKYALLNFYKDSKHALGLHQLRGFTRLLIGVFLLIIIIFIGFFISVVNTKLDENTKYFINGNSEFYGYIPFGESSSRILLQDFRLSDNCDEFKGEIEKEKTILSLGKGSSASISRYSSSNVRLDIVSARMSGNEAIENEFADIVATLEGEEFIDCLSVEIILSETMPIFTMNILGEIITGSEITDAPDQYNKMFLEGSIIIEGNSALSNSRLTYDPVDVPRGTRITIARPVLATKGVLRASKYSEGIESNIVISGGEIFTQMYREAPKKVTLSFINRIGNDNEAVIGFSALIIIIQFFSAVLAFLMRLKFINNTASNQDIGDD